jgi:hypothetical protein
MISIFQYKNWSFFAPLTGEGRNFAALNKGLQASSGFLCALPLHSLPLLVVMLIRGTSLRKDDLRLYGFGFASNFSWLLLVLTVIWLTY